MMKRLNYILALALTAASCSTGSEMMPDNPYAGGERCAIELSGEIGDHAATRVAIGNPAHIQSGAAVYAWAQDTSTGSDHVSLWTLTADGSGSFTGDTKYFPMTGSSLKARAFTGNFTATPTTWGTYTHQVVPDQKTVSRVSDLLYGVSEPKLPNGLTTDIPVTFRHMLAKVRVAICPSSGNVADYEGMTVRVVNGGGTIAFTPNKNATPTTLAEVATRAEMLGTQSLAHDVHLTPTVVANFDTEPSSYGEAVVIPRAYGGGETPLFRLFSADGLTELRSFSTETFNSETFVMQSGMEYTFKITLLDDEMYFNDEYPQMIITHTIKPWGADEDDTNAESVAYVSDPTTLWGLKDLVNQGLSASSYIGYYVDNEGHISATSGDNTVGVVAAVSNATVDESVAGSRILVLANQLYGNIQWYAGDLSTGSYLYDASNKVYRGFAYSQAMNDSSHPAIQTAWAHTSTGCDTGYGLKEYARAVNQGKWFLPCREQMEDLMGLKNGGYGGSVYSTVYHDTYFQWSSSESNAGGWNYQYGGKVWSTGDENGVIDVRPVFAF